jgi:hypothetical protein
MNWFTAFFGKILKKGEGYLKHSVSIEQPLWVYLVVVFGAFLLGVIVHAVA